MRISAPVLRSELEHVIRAASDLVDDPDIVVVGSQAILGQYPDAPPPMLISMEADVYPRSHPARAILIDGAIGELSMFQETFGYYAHGVGEETATAPAGWQQRLVPVRNENTGGATGWCLEAHDLVLAKCVAGREKDWAFADEAIRHGLVEGDVLLARAADLPVSDAARDYVTNTLTARIAALRPGG